MSWIGRVGLLGLLLAIFTPACSTPQISGNERLTVAYRLTNGRVRVRHSPDGLTWTTATTFPVLRATVSGPGAGATPDGVTHLVAGEEDDGGTDIKRWFCWSLGSNSYSDLVDQPSIGAVWTSAPSVAFAGNKTWLIAFRSGALVRVFSWNTGTKQATNLNFTDTSNVSVTGRPALAIRDDKLVMTYHRNPPGNAPPRIEVVTGTVDGGVPTFNAATTLANVEPGTVEIERHHDLSHDTNNFVLAVVRQDASSGQPLQTHSLFIYDSADGVAWTRRTRFGVGTPPNLSVRVAPMSMGALSDGTVLAAFLTPSGLDVFRFSSGSWSVVDGTTLFDSTPSLGHDFAMFSAGVP